jgi:pimeloyl-ACP methyl ester carboxylesterase
MNTAVADVLDIAYLDDGLPSGWPVFLSHGFPFDVHAYDEVVPLLTSQGARVIRPFLRGFGPTRFRSPDTRRSGQQAALGADLIALMDALDLKTAILAGYDWGGLASCVAAGLWPERVAGLVSMSSYDINDLSALKHTLGPALEHAVWYQHLFQTERGRECLLSGRRALCRMLWQQWCPTWSFDESTFERSAAAFENPDFVDVVIHYYRHQFGVAAGDPVYDALEQRLAGRPPIQVPAVTLDGRYDPLRPGGTADQASMFTARHEHFVIDVGHNLPQEAPDAFAEAVLLVRR